MRGKKNERKTKPKKASKVMELKIKAIPQKVIQEAIRGPKSGIRRALPKEIVVGFESHMPGFVEKKKKYFDKADIILCEIKYTTIEKLKNIKTGDVEAIKLLAERYSKFPEVSEKYFTLLKEQMDKGKTVIGTEIKTEEIKEYANKGETSTGFKSIIANAEETKRREGARLYYILKNLKKFKNKKVYVDAGAMHTPLYHNLKRALKREERVGRTKIKQEHLAKGMYEHPRILHKYNPFSQMERMFRFKKLEGVDIKRMLELAKQKESYFEVRLMLESCYRKLGMTEEQASEKAGFEVARMQKRKWLEKKE